MTAQTTAFLAIPVASNRSANCLRIGLCWRATRLGMNSVARNDVFPVRLIIVRPLSEVPELRCLGVTPINAESAFALSKRRISPRCPRIRATVVAPIPGMLEISAASCLRPGWRSMWSSNILFQLFDLGAEPFDMRYNVRSDIFHAGDNMGFQSILLLLTDVLERLNAKRPSTQLALFDRWRLPKAPASWQHNSAQ